MVQKVGGFMPAAHGDDARRRKLQCAYPGMKNQKQKLAKFARKRDQLFPVLKSGTTGVPCAGSVVNARNRSAIRAVTGPGTLP
jgi:hypothetical protein